LRSFQLDVVGSLLSAGMRPMELRSSLRNLSVVAFHPLFFFQIREKFDGVCLGYGAACFCSYLGVFGISDDGAALFSFHGVTSFGFPFFSLEERPNPLPVKNSILTLKAASFSAITLFSLRTSAGLFLCPLFFLGSRLVMAS